MKWFLYSLILSLPYPAKADTCFNDNETKQIEQMVLELNDIHDSETELWLEEPILIIHDWDGRTYVNGGDTKPIRAKLTIGHFIERELQIQLPVNVQTREKPPDPMFRLRFRAQVLLLFPGLADYMAGKGDKPFDGGLGLDFFHIDFFNVSVNVGVLSFGSTIGIDATKNFGLHAGYVMLYSGFRSGSTLGVYFSFN